MTIRILRFPEMTARIGGYTRMHINRLEKDGKFPKRIKLGGNSVGWIESEIEEWLADKARCRPQTAQQVASQGRMPGPQHPAP